MQDGREVPGRYRSDRGHRTITRLANQLKCRSVYIGALEKSWNIWLETLSFYRIFKRMGLSMINLKYKGIKFSKWFPKASPHFDYTRSISFFGNIALVLVWSSDNYFTLKVGVRVPFTGCKSIHVSKTSMKKDIYFERKFTLY